MARGVLEWLRALCEASDPIWLICRTKGVWTTRVLLVLCEVTALIPPPPSWRDGVLGRGWALGALAAVPRAGFRIARLALWMVVSLVVSLANLYLMLIGMVKFTAGLSSMSLMCYVSSTCMSAVQPVVVVLNQLCNFSTMAPAVVCLFMPPARTHPRFLAAALFTFSLILSKHVIFALNAWTPLVSNLTEFLATLFPFAFDTLLQFLCLFAEDKFQDLNTSLSMASKALPGLRALILETSARQYELIADQVTALGGLRSMGVPLALNSLRHRVKLVSDSYFLYRSLQNHAFFSYILVAGLFLQLLVGVMSIVSTTYAGDRMYRESKRTEVVLGAVNTMGWTERELLLVNRILRISQRGVIWSMGQLADMNHSFLLAVIGSTATYLVVLMQYKDPIIVSGVNATNANATSNATGGK